jgi:two-component system LytT family response regulator
MKTPIRALVVDDEPLARAGLRELLAAEGDVEIAGECGDGLAALTFLNREKIDLLFLDVQMPELDGFETLAAIANAPLPAIIFVTAYDEYALRAFEVHAVDYLLKPLNPERFRAALAHAREQIQVRREHALPPNLAALLANRFKPLERVLIKNGGRYLVVRTHEVDWISAEADYACLHVQDKKHLLRETLSALEQKLDPQKFLRVHRSAIVNLDRIQAMESLSHGELVLILKNGARVTASRNYRAKLAQCFQNML